MRVRCFGANNLSDFLPLPGHDDNLAGDIVTTLALNYKWRVFVTNALDNLLAQNKYILSESDYDDLETLYLLMLDDIYT